MQQHKKRRITGKPLPVEHVGRRDGFFAAIPGPWFEKVEQVGSNVTRKGACSGVQSKREIKSIYRQTDQKAQYYCNGGGGRHGQEHDEQRVNEHIEMRAQAVANIFEQQHLQRRQP